MLPILSPVEEPAVGGVGGEGQPPILSVCVEEKDKDHQEQESSRVL